MKTLEEQIEQKRDQFDVDEPGAGHIENFEKKLNRSAKLKKQRPLVLRGMFLRIAASILILFALSAGIIGYRSGLFDFNLSKNIASANLPVELLEVAKYYNIVTNKKIGMLNKLVSSNEEGNKIKKNAQAELDALDVTAKELQQEYLKNSKDDRIYAAIVEIQKKKSEIIDKMINSLN